MEIQSLKSKFEVPGNEGKKALETAKSIEVVSADQNKNWAIEDLKNEMTRSFLEAGGKALEQNNGVIYVTLSGGVDSSLGLAILRKNFPDAKIVAFTMGGDEDHPDVVHARLAAEKFNADHEVIIPNKDDIQETLEEYQAKFPSVDTKQAVVDGDFDVYLLYKYISKTNPKILLAYDGIDELMGGYWGHRKGKTAEERKKAFQEYWDRLIPFHLKPLLATSQKFGVNLIFPYLDKGLAQMISKIPVSDRVSDEIGKLPVRELAKIFEVPEEIITRSKRGQVGMLDVEELRKNKS